MRVLFLSSLCFRTRTHSLLALAPTHVCLGPSTGRQRSAVPVEPLRASEFDIVPKTGPYYPLRFRTDSGSSFA